MLIAGGFYAYQKLQVGAEAVAPPPPTPPPTGEFVSDLPQLDLGSQWSLIALPYVKITGQDPQPILTQLCKDCHLDPKPTTNTYYPIYRLAKNDTDFALYSQTAPATPTGFPVGNFSGVASISQPGLGYWIYVDQEDDSVPELNLENYGVASNNYYTVALNTATQSSNLWTAVGNPYLDEISTASVQLTYQYNNDAGNPKYKNLKLSEALDQNIVIAYTYDGQNFGSEWQKLTGTDTIASMQGVLVKTLAKNSTITFYKPTSSE